VSRDMASCPESIRQLTYLTFVSHSGDRFCGAHAAHIFHGKAPGREGCNRSRGRKSFEMRAHHTDTKCAPTHFTPQQQRLKRPFLFLVWCRKCTTSQENRCPCAEIPLSLLVECECGALGYMSLCGCSCCGRKSFLRCSEELLKSLALSEK
jgi:hypothetical protein